MLKLFKKKFKKNIYNKNMKNIESSTLYQDCFFSLEEDFVYEIENSCFDNCNFENISFSNLKGCKFNNCKFVNVFALYVLAESYSKKINSYVYDLKDLTELYVIHKPKCKRPFTRKNLELDLMHQANFFRFKENYRLKNIPENIESLRKLKVLDLSYSGLTTLPRGITKIKTLEVLNLSFNKLESLPSCIKKLKNLSLLKLARNPIGYNDILTIQSYLPHCRMFFN
ncbi:hypothetical protein [Candidatus Uabimicrobium sp. HlEnr_7]|uniref:hypothetical protein n=1 Tax=Candidatus Uabimicrobium helgolandensis TaxID=3095367 RepID=UPI003557E5E7